MMKKAVFFYQFLKKVSFGDAFECIERENDAISRSKRNDDVHDGHVHDADAVCFVCKNPNCITRLSHIACLCDLWKEPGSSSELPVFLYKKMHNLRRRNMKNRKKNLGKIALGLILALSLTACGGKGSKVTIAIPNDTTNEARALLLLQENGYIKLKDGADLLATPKDIAENPKNIEFKEIEAAQLPSTLKDVDYAIINSNYALDAGLNPVEKSLIKEGSTSAYVNVISVKQGNENTDKTKALLAAVQSQDVVDFINKEYNGGVLPAIDHPTDGKDPGVDYAALKGQTITIAASPTPHAEILAVAKGILEKQGITLEIKEFTDYVQPNNVVESGEIDANFFQHVPYMENFNQENGTHIVSIGGVHVEPMGLYGGKQTTLDALK